ncbi:hypothetical protein ACWCQ1_47175, partial [Streptomyces sp. NPDC002144]
TTQTPHPTSQHISNTPGQQPPRTPTNPPPNDTITRLQHINQDLDCSPETETTQLINHLLGATRDGTRNR